MKPENVEGKKSKLDVNFDTGKIKEIIVNFVVPIVSISISVLLVILYIRPSIKEVQTEKANLSNKMALEQVLSRKLSVLNNLVDFTDMINENSYMVDRILVPEADVPRLLDQINQIAVNSGMIVNRLGYSYGTVATSGDMVDTQESFDLVSISLGTDSNYDQLIVFMELIENAARFVFVSDFRYSTSASLGTGEISSISGSFSIDSPYLLIQSSAVTDEPIDLDITSQKFVSFINMIRSLKYYEFLDTNIVAEELRTDDLSDGNAEEFVPPEPGVVEVYEESPLIPDSEQNQ